MEAEVFSEFGVSNDEPATVDRLDRGRYAASFARLAEECATPFTIGIYGGWGIGKTSLMCHIEARLNRDLVLPVRFNLWEHQFDDNPVISFSQELAAAAGLETGRRARKLLYAIAVAVGSHILKKGADFDFGSLVHLGEAYDKSHFRVADARHKLREHLKVLVGMAQKSQAHRRRLVFFIDDVDRCAPDAALHLLEFLKLYLNSEGCVYFVAIDRDALRKSVAAKYERLGIDEADYLDKFIQMPFTVPPIEPRAMGAFVASILPEGLKCCADLLLSGLGDNPRSVKRVINVLTFHHRLASDLAIPRYEARVLALIVLMQEMSPNTYRELVSDVAQTHSPTSTAPDGRLAKACCNNPRLSRAASHVDLESVSTSALKYYLYLTSLSSGLPADLDLPATPSDEDAPLNGRYVLWVDDGGIQAAEGVAERLQKLGVAVSIVASTEAAEAKLRKHKPDLIISDIGRGEDHDAGLVMAESFQKSGLFEGPYYFFTTDQGHGRLGRACAVGGQLFLEREPLVREVVEYLSIHGRPRRPSNAPANAV